MCIVNDRGVCQRCVLANSSVVMLLLAPVNNAEQRLLGVGMLLFSGSSASLKLLEPLHLDLPVMRTRFGAGWQVARRSQFVGVHALPAIPQNQIIEFVCNSSCPLDSAANIDLHKFKNIGQARKV